MVRYDRQRHEAGHLMMMIGYMQNLALLIDCGPVSSVDIGGHIEYQGCVEIEQEMLSIHSQIL